MPGSAFLDVVVHWEPLPFRRPGYRLLSIPGGPGTGLAALFHVAITPQPSPSPNHPLGVLVKRTGPSSPRCWQ